MNAKYDFEAPKNVVSFDHRINVMNDIKEAIDSFKNKSRILKILAGSKAYVNISLMPNTIFEGNKLLSFYDIPCVLDTSLNESEITFVDEGARKNNG